ncbi:tRNA pseudouridine(38-40) synthase TruA [Candidatus Karelsulcia muelleri]|uniref:tRNA pseudouridine synthase A n=1 Tax=Candidatus Karelsulcia muelleri TaxID=336810 RepID=UPI0023647E33|nr:tRNA pseudouridine synthase A [Candidatus Karelsulcia muelleri]WDE42208.1 tRNA pseudouridine(38-40) synthase TruA [Candidatus Karelsulcia muelleri]WDR79055.1 tRNA pseudouridine(38-40) synthase TruA [Candidatus Karelsulcia muelleri]
MRYFLELSYNGKYFSGWQIQKSKHKKQISIQDTLAKCIALILRKNISILGASRTDTGVNAIQMFAHFDSVKVLKTKKFVNKINILLPNYIVIRNILQVKTNASARYDVISRHYQYRINLCRGPFSYNYLKFPFRKINYGIMNKAGFILKNLDDFSPFGKKISPNSLNLCKLYYFTWSIRNRVLYIDLIANRFLRNMVRRIIGTFLYLGIGKINMLEFCSFINKQKKILSCPSVPAKGLYLVRVRYPKSIFLESCKRTLFKPV